MLHSASKTNQLDFIESLARIRQEWQDAANGDSLLNMEGNVGLFLADIVNGLALGNEDQAKVLGQSLFQEIQELRSTSNSN